MNIIELLQHVGPENVRIQRVDESIRKARVVDGATTLLELETNAISVGDVAAMTSGVPLPLHGLILWLPRPALLEDAPGKPPDWADRLAELWIHNSAAFGGDTWKQKLAERVRSELARTLAGVVLTHEQATRFVKTLGAVRAALLKPEHTDMTIVNADLKVIEKELHAAVRPPAK